jgi:hypothetical protein
MINPEDDAELAKAIEDEIIPVADPIENSKAEEPKPPHKDTSGLGKNVDDFEIEVPPPEGI